ncbi:hypothetical protein Salat_2999900 [Sesamum alatum]|uniref:Uncharacterized protein n=1 Tax=Sesamum alatum TaxID=300844 RepID=A0AAE1XHG9_9LAMI|nr:hypothetical protein Salat_2999900 [Sesamum alatum]
MPTRDRRMLLLGLRRHLMEKSKFWVPGGSNGRNWLKLKGIDGEGTTRSGACGLILTQHGETYQLVDWRFVWLIPLNERDLSLLTSYAEVSLRGQLLRGTTAF